MLNVQFQICGVLLIILVLIFYSRLPKLPLRTTRAFGCMLPIAAMAAFLDIVSVLCIYYAEYLSDFTVKLICKLYLIVLMSLLIVNFVYLCADAFSSTKTFKKAVTVIGSIFVVLMAAASFLPINYVCEDEGHIIYSEGAFTLACYGIYALMFVAMFVIVIIKKDKMHRSRKLAVWIWLISLLITALIQFFNSRLLLVTFGVCMDILILFLMIENPEFCIDRESGFFHTTSFSLFFNEVYSEKDCYIITTRYNLIDVKFFEQFKDAVIFSGGGDIYLTFENKEHYDDALLRISKTLHKRSIYVCEDRGIMGEGAELLRTFKKMRDLKRLGKAVRFRRELSNVYYIGSDVMALFEERTAAKDIITQAIADKNGYSIEPFFQPIYSIKTGQFSSAEALARIRDNSGNIIPPMKFIPVAEENGSIIELGKVMFDKVCSFLSGVEDIGLKYVEVNLSIVQCEDENLADDICSIMGQHTISAEMINLEITETASISGREQLLANMKKMIEKGIGFSLDDFGTGQSNLDYMTVMPVKLVKFDRSMTQSYFVLDTTKSVMKAAVQMIHDMNMKVVIEGIETAEQLDEMKRLGVDYIQGYYFSKPLPQDEFVTFLKERNNISAQAN